MEEFETTRIIREICKSMCEFPSQEEAVRGMHAIAMELIRTRQCPSIETIERLTTAETRLEYADKLAYEVARAILNREHGERSAVSDSLLNYLNIGGIDGPKTVPEWIDKYRAAKGIE